MRISEVQKLAEIMERYSLTALRIGEGDERIELERGAAAQPAASPSHPAQPMPAAMEEAPAAAQASPAVADASEVLSPMVGVFYTSPSPDAAPFVKVGDRVQKGDVLCIIEAMKLMNEITAEVSGVVTEICVDNGQLVEYDQCLMRIE